MSDDDDGFLLSGGDSIPNEDEVELSEVAEATYQVILPALSALGLAGNFLCIVVLLGRRFRKHASYVYLRSLAWADSAYLILTLQVRLNK